MAYQFRRSDRTVQKGVRRIALEQIGRALARLDAPEPLTADDIHALRTTVKKLRGLVQLIRPGFADHGAEDDAFRDAGRAVSAPRDSEVMLATLDLLAPRGLPKLRAALRAQLAAAHADHVLDAGLDAYRDAMRAAQDRAQGWKVRGKGFAPLHDGLEASFRAARKAMAAARHDPLPERLHEARKRVKAHGYQTRLLVPIWPAQMEAHLAVATDLGELLGQMNDLSVFVSRLAALPIPETERTRADALARARHARLTAQAFPVAARLLAERPEDLARRWQAWWEIWRSEG